jgi:hypothetical protein
MILKNIEQKIEKLIKLLLHITILFTNKKLWHFAAIKNDLLPVKYLPKIKVD